MEDIIAVVVLLVIIGLAAWYLYKAKKRGEHCVGCPYSKTCASKNSGAGCSGGCGGKNHS